MLPLLLMVVLQACRSGSGSGKMQVVASIEPLAYFVERIGGDRVSVSVMVPPGGDPHSYEPTPRQMARLGSAALFVKAGSGVEFELNWMPRFLGLNHALRVCDASEGVRLIPMAHADRHDAPAGRQGRHDPHFWLSPANARVIAANVERSLAAIDQPHRGEYEANLAKLDGELAALDGQIRQRLDGVPNRRFIVFHPAWGYFARDFGLEQMAVEQEGKELTPVQMARVIRLARSAGIRTVFVSPQFSSAQADAIAHDIGGTTATVDPLSREYQGNLRRAAEAFAGGMR
ncbi:MAG: zinc ABC transporter solute-binding protein [Chlorobiaceae bacterium]|nr:zinc ABC transporter solute-binding protein [Chlorobiaceae bacterium]